MMQEQAGQGGSNIFLEIEGEETEVCTTRFAAKLTGFSQSYIRQMCDSGKLIAIKKYGRWWVHLAELVESDVMRLPF